MTLLLAGLALAQAVSPQAVSPQAVSPQAVSPQAVSPQAVSPQAVSPQAVSPEPPQQWMALGLTLPSLSHPGLVLGGRREVGAAWQLGLDLAGWVNPSDSLHGQLTPQLGAVWQRPSGLRIVGSIGLGLGVERRITGHMLDLADGSSQRSWESQVWAVPQISTQLSWRHERQFPLFLGFTLGQQLAQESNGGTVLTVNFGVLLSRRESP
ncbi:MAG: hypothetical protein ACI9VR_000100 [Cognaticolwellia sp.]